MAGGEIEIWLLKFPMLRIGDTALHSGKDLAVSPLMLPSELIPLKGYLVISDKDVSARTSWITPDGRYPLPFSKKCPDFPLRREAGAIG